ncbi:hypothetical protein PF006_g22369 [Phytophthora fragariae]|uniref:RxLR effector protein n=1 Tax=Phytophthora fragariae TaxID=53985 RepID=A0A6A3RT10_9STRA|nr:hypothetical protein PF006_g22369 [Phytophthora fragariae]KAE9190360.1 hypothetical protein PF004_g21927 [Phytophthora fragariae]
MARHPLSSNPTYPWPIFSLRTHLLVLVSGLLSPALALEELLELGVGDTAPEELPQLLLLGERSGDGGNINEYSSCGKSSANSPGRLQLAGPDVELHPAAPFMLTDALKVGDERRTNRQQRRQQRRTSSKPKQSH